MSDIVRINGSQRPPLKNTNISHAEADFEARVTQYIYNIYNNNNNIFIKVTVTQTPLLWIGGRSPFQSRIDSEIYGFDERNSVAVATPRGPPRLFSAVTRSLRSSRAKAKTERT